MTRSTSIEAYHTIRDNGMLSRRRFEVYETLFHYGPMTANETFVQIARQRPGMRFDSNTHARFTELRDMGVAAELGARPCSITGMNAILWDVTDRLPVALERKTPLVEQLRDALKKYSRCLDSCDTKTGGLLPCSCGLAKARKL